MGCSGRRIVVPQPFSLICSRPIRPAAALRNCGICWPFTLTDFPGQQFFWRKLKKGMTPDVYSNRLSFIRAVNGMPFPTAGLANVPKDINLGLGMLDSYAKGTLGIPVTDSYYCAQSIAATWLHIGLLDGGLASNGGIPNAYVPEDFDSTGESQLPLAAGVVLGDVILVHYDLPIDLTPPPSGE